LFRSEDRNSGLSDSKRHEVYGVVTEDLRIVMGLVIVWRNPNPVQTVQQSTRMSKNVSFARYFLEELMGRAQEETWIDASTMEILREGNISEPCAKKPAINASRGTGAKGRTPASTDERRVPSLQTPLEPLITLLRGLIVGSRNGQWKTVTAPEAKKTPQASNAV
jgi:hypothetical protein